MGKMKELWEKLEEIEDPGPEAVESVTFVPGARVIFNAYDGRHTARFIEDLGDKGCRIKYEPPQYDSDEDIVLRSDLELVPEAGEFPASHPAVEYLQSIFKAGDRICVQLIHATEKYPSGQAKTEEYFQGLEETTAAGSIDFLKKKQVAGWHVYVCMNPFQAEAGRRPRALKNRIEDLISEVRTVYVEADDNGEEVRTDIGSAVGAGEIPTPHFVLQSSPGKYQFVWKAEKMTLPEQRALNEALVARFKADPACVDGVRLLRVPGFYNLKPKYGNPPPIVTIVGRSNGNKERYTPKDFGIKIDVSAQVAKQKERMEAIGSEQLHGILDVLTENFEAAGVTHSELKTHGDSYKYLLDECPWADEHSETRDGAAVFISAAGALGFHCFHAHCADRDWHSFRAEVERRAGHQLKFGTAPELLLGGKPFTEAEYGAALGEAQTTKRSSGAQNSSGSPLSGCADSIAPISTAKVEDVRPSEARRDPKIDLDPDEAVPPYNAKLIRGFYSEVVELVTRGTTIPVQFPHLIAKTYLGLRIAVHGGKFQDCEDESRVIAALIGESGTGKGWSEKRCRNVFTCFGQERESPSHIKIWDGADSGAGLKESFWDYPEHAGILLVIDEVMDLGSKTRGDRQPEILTTLLTLAEATTIARVKSNKKERKQKTDARLAAILCGQPDIFTGAFAGTKVGALGFFNRMSPEFSNPVIAGERPPMENLRAEVEPLYDKYRRMDFSKVLISQGEQAKRRIEDYWNSLPAEEQVLTRRKRNLYVNQFLIAAGMMPAGLEGLTATAAKTTLQDADDAIQDDIRQSVIRRLYLSTQISDQVSGYLAKLRTIMEKMETSLRNGAAPANVAKTERDFCKLTNAHRDNEQHIFEKAWKSFQPMYLVALVEEPNKSGRKTVRYLPRP